MDADTPRTDHEVRVGVRELRGNLTRYLREAQRGYLDLGHVTGCRDRRDPSARPAVPSSTEARCAAWTDPHGGRLRCAACGRVGRHGRTRILLDTHALLWWLSDDGKLGPHARPLIADPANDVLVSIASLWEIVVKIRVGKLKADLGAIERTLAREGLDRLEITSAHLANLETLPRHHGDPFDHLLIAQAIHEGATLVSEGPVMSLYPVKLLRCSQP